MVQAWDGKGMIVWEHQFPRLLSNVQAMLGDRDGDGVKDLVVVVPTYEGNDKDQSSENGHQTELFFRLQMSELSNSENCLNNKLSGRMSACPY